jgi:hypothetical protein
MAEEWCCFALNLKQPIFRITPGTETQLFRWVRLCQKKNMILTYMKRKWIICVLDKPEHSAQRIIDTAPASCKACPRTLYMLYKLALSRENSLLGM